jgi:hypothetical protein
MAQLKGANSVFPTPINESLCISSLIGETYLDNDQTMPDPLDGKSRSEVWQKWGGQLFFIALLHSPSHISLSRQGCSNFKLSHPKSDKWLANPWYAVLHLSWRRPTNRTKIAKEAVLDQELPFICAHQCS